MAVDRSTQKRVMAPKVFHSLDGYQQITGPPPANVSAQTVMRQATWRAKAAPKQPPVIQDS